MLTQKHSVKAMALFYEKRASHRFYHVQPIILPSDRQEKYKIRQKIVISNPFRTIREMAGKNTRND